MTVRFEYIGILIGVALTLFSMESIATQGQGTYPGHQVLFWGALFFGAACFAYFAKQIPKKGAMRSVTVVMRRRVRQWL